MPLPSVRLPFTLSLGEQRAKFFIDLYDERNWFRNGARNAVGYTK